MIIYEVNLKISNSIYKKFILWLDVHIQEMLLFEGFIDYKKYLVQSQNKDYKLLSIHYYIENHKVLDNYFNNYSSIMRKKGTDLFKNQFIADRRILLVED